MQPHGRRKIDGKEWIGKEIILVPLLPSQVETPGNQQGWRLPLRIIMSTMETAYIRNVSAKYRALSICLRAGLAGTGSILRVLF